MGKKYKYYVRGHSINSSDSIVRMRSRAVKLIKEDYLAYNPVSIYSDSYLSGIYPVSIVKLFPDGRFMCRENDAWREIDDKGKLKGRN